MNYLKILGINIREARKDLGLKQYAVAEILGVSNQTISGIEKGSRTGKSLAEYLFFLKKNNIKMDDLFILPKGNIDD